MLSSRDVVLRFFRSSLAGGSGCNFLVFGLFRCMPTEENVEHEEQVVSTSHPSVCCHIIGAIWMSELDQINAAIRIMCVGKKVRMLLQYSDARTCPNFAFFYIFFAFVTELWGLFYLEVVGKIILLLV